MARFLFIVARELPDVYEHLREQFGLEPDVEVILDRRRGARRQAEPPGGAPSAEPLEPDRRQNTTADAQLRVMGYAFVRLDK